MSFKIVATTDVHGNLLSYDFINSTAALKGLSRLSTLLKEEREKSKVIYIDNGDINQGTPLVTFSNANLKNNIMAKALNYLKCDYINLGNHDFNYGTDFLNNYIKETNAKCITENVKYKNKNLGKTEIIEIEGKKIAFIGVVTDYIHNWEKEQNLKDIEILDVFKTVKSEVEKVKNIVDIIVVVYHGGFEKDIETKEPTEELTGENIGYKICTEIPEIDLLITGHQHRNIVGKIKNTVVIQCSDSCFSCMEISFEKKIKAKIIELSNYEIDKKMEEEFKDILEETKKYLDIEIGTCNIEMYIKDIEQAQKQKHPITAFINKIQKEHMNADISACCLFDNIPGFGKKLKYKDIILNYPFPNTLVLKEISGENIIKYLNQLSNYWIIKEDKITINPKFLSPKREIYNYDLLDGIEYTFNISKSKKNFVTEVKINGEKINLTKKYKLALNNYRASGGGNFSFFKELKTLKEDTTDIAEIIIEYIKKEKYIYIEDKKNIKYKIID